MSENSNDASNPQGREREPGHARPMNPLFSGRLGRLSGIGTSSPYRNSGPTGALITFLILFAILIGVGVGAATQSFLIGVGIALMVIVLVIGCNLLIKRIMRARNQL